MLRLYIPANKNHLTFTRVNIHTGMASAHGFTVIFSFGSLTDISDAAGNRMQEINFDAWGNRRNPNTWRAFASAPPEPLFDRGFTGHSLSREERNGKHLYGFQLINMNGRMGVYPERHSLFGNPVVSRMLSPDNFVQAPDFSQSFNRYSYAWHNPLVYTDPDGELLFIIPYLSFNASGILCSHPEPSSSRSHRLSRA